MPCSLLRVAPGARTHLFYALTRMGRTVFVVSATDYDAKQQFDRCYYGNKVYLPSAHVELRLVEAKSCGKRGGWCSSPWTPFSIKCGRRNRFMINF